MSGLLEIVLGVAVFTGVVLCLVLVILAARSRLVASGRASIVVNDERLVESPVGVKLLEALADAEIRVPSGCGGKGTCGQCRVVILEGGGAVLPTEKARLSRQELARDVRLACQVTVKGDLRVGVAEEIFGVEEWTCTVLSSRNVGTLIKELVLELPEGESIQFRAGAFVQVECPPYEASFRSFDIDPEFRDEWDRLDLWRYRATCSETTSRAYSLANCPEESGIAALLVRLAIPPPGVPEGVPPGVVSSYLFGRSPGDQVRISGPFGQFHATDGEREMIFIGGGAGMAPMRAHILDQLERLRTKRQISFWYGARNLRELFYVEEFDRLEAEHENFRWIAALSEPRAEDRWEGPVGFIHQVLYERYLEEHPAPEECEYYLCGPPMMTKAVLRMLDNLGVEAESIRFDDFGG